MIGLDCHFVEGEKDDLPDDYAFSISLLDRIRPEEVLHYSIRTVMLFKCSSSVYQDKFKEISDRLSKKGKWGVATISGVPNYKLYLVPYGPFSQKFVAEAKEGDMVGLYMVEEQSNPIA